MRRKNIAVYKPQPEFEQALYYALLCSGKSMADSNKIAKLFVMRAGFVRAMSPSRSYLRLLMMGHNKWCYNMGKPGSCSLSNRHVSYVLRQMKFTFYGVQPYIKKYMKLNA